jgi:serine/threonine protein kinase
MTTLTTLVDGPPAVPAPELVGQHLHGKYRLIRSIAAGGMGEVFEAEDLADPAQHYAIKVLRAPYNAVALQRFHREAQIASELAHENIVAVHDFQIAQNGMPYLVMELLQGEDLSARIRRVAPMALGDVVAIVRQIALGLHAAHRAGIVHRDLKPQNVFLVAAAGGGDRVKLLDFGVSKYRDAQPVTHDNSITGTPNYMSPEQAEGSIVDIDERTDVFALGVVAWEMLAGRLAFDAPTVSGTLYQVVHLDPPPLHRLRPDLPPIVEDVLAAAMAKLKRARYPSGLMLAEALAQVAAMAEQAALAHAPTAPAMEAVTPPSTVELVPAAPRTVLFVDDSPSMCALVSTWLTTAGHHVIVASDGIQGGNSARLHRPDLIVADVSMPRCDGFSLCRSLKDDPQTSHIPVILFTRLDEATDIINGLAARADAFVVKRSNPRDLLRQVEHLLPGAIHPARRATTVIERLRGRFETLGRNAIFKQLFDACFREVPFDVLAILVARIAKPPLVLLGSHYELATERADELAAQVVAGYHQLTGGDPGGDIEAQQIVVDETAPLGSVEAEVARSVMVPMLDGEDVIGNLAVFSFEDHPGLDENIRFFFDIGVAAARALRRP